MDDSFVIDVLILGRDGVSLGGKLLNCSLKLTKAIVPVSKRNLRSNENQQSREQDFAFHIAGSADIPVGGSRASRLASR